MSDTRPLLIVDGDNLAHRAFHSTPKTVRAPDGSPLNAIVGFFSMLHRICQEEDPRGVFVAWDTLGVDTYRNRLWPNYQTGRDFDPEIVAQLNVLPSICAGSGLGIGKAAGHEADDLMGSAAKVESRSGGNSLLLTTDRDSYQLVDDRVTVLSPKRGTRTLERVGPAQVVAYFGVLPEQVPDFKALSGDGSDRIPGIAGIGPKTAAGLLLRHGTLDAVVEGWQPDQANLARMFREVATIQTELEVELPSGPPNWAAAASILRDLGATALADRLAG